MLSFRAEPSCLPFHVILAEFYLYVELWYFMLSFLEVASSVALDILLDFGLAWTILS